jgi:hypothetical protein
LGDGLQIDDITNVYPSTSLINLTAGFANGIGYKLHAPGGLTTIEAIITVSRSFLSIVAEEWTGLPSSAVFDNWLQNAQLAPGAGPGAITSGTFPTSGTDFVWGVLGDLSATPGVISQGSGFTLNSQNPGPQTAVYTEFNPSAAQSSSMAATFGSTVGNVSSNWFLASAIAFKLSAGVRPQGSPVLPWMPVI